MRQSITFVEQQGAVLAVSLIMLVILTLVGVTAMQMTVNDEKMVGNMRDRSIAFEAAEAAVRDAEAYIAGVASIVSFNGSGGLLGEGNGEPDYASVTTWDAANTPVLSRQYTNGVTTFPGVSTQPRFVIKHLGDRDPMSAGGFNNLSPGFTAQRVSEFKIIARGTGMTNSSQVILQSFFARIF